MPARPTTWRSLPRTITCSWPSNSPGRRRANDEREDDRLCRDTVDGRIDLWTGSRGRRVGEGDEEVGAGGGAGGGAEGQPRPPSRGGQSRGGRRRAAQRPR